MTTILVGLSYKSAEVGIREKLHFNSNTLKSALKQLSQQNDVEECAILSTCNRVELYASTSNISKGLKSLENFLTKYHTISKTEIKPHLYRLASIKAVTHLFRVAASLDSMVVGENQILKQVRIAYSEAYDNGFTKPILNRLFQMAISTGKKVRSQTNIGKGAVSVGSVAVDLVKEIFPPNYSFNVCLVGAGKISELTAKSLKQYGNIQLTMINRSFDKAVALAKQFNGGAVAWEERYAHIIAADVVLVSTSSQEFVVEYEEFKKELRAYKGSKMRFLIDLSVPRNIDPRIQSIDDTVIYAIDDLQKIVEQNINKRQFEIGDGEKLVNVGVDDFFSWYYKRQIMDETDKLIQQFKLFQESSDENLMNASSQWKDILVAIVSKVQNQRDLKAIYQTLIDIKSKVFIKCKY